MSACRKTSHDGAINVKEVAPDPIALVALVDAAYPAVLEIGEPGSSTVELTVHVRARPAPGWLACRVTTRHVIAGYHEEDFEIWDATTSTDQPP